MFKSMLALIPCERPVRPVVEGAVVLAMACHAHVNALAIGYESTKIPIAIAGPVTEMTFQGKPATRYRARRDRNERF